VTFLRAAFLLGLAGAAVPVVLHLIYRQRYPERPFTTLRFFRVTIKHNVMQRRLIDRLLLLLRVLALVALALALARPFWSGPVGEARRSVVVVVDNSPSMGRAAGSRTLFAKAQAAALNLLADRGAAGPSGTHPDGADVRPGFHSGPCRRRGGTAAAPGRAAGGCWCGAPPGATPRCRA